MPKQSYGNWLYDQVKAGKPTNGPTPIGVETYEEWFKRIRGLSDAAPLANAKLAEVAAPSVRPQRAKNLAAYNLG